jgi:hypothetical protein
MNFNHRKHTEVEASFRQVHVKPLVFVTPAKAGVQRRCKTLDSGFRRNDVWKLPGNHETLGFLPAFQVLRYLRKNSHGAVEQDLVNLIRESG